MQHLAATDHRCAYLKLSLVQNTVPVPAVNVRHTSHCCQVHLWSQSVQCGCRCSHTQRPCLTRFGLAWRDTASRTTSGPRYCSLLPASPPSRRARPLCLLAFSHAALVFTQATPSGMNGVLHCKGRRASLVRMPCAARFQALRALVLENGHAGMPVDGACRFWLRNLSRTSICEQSDSLCSGLMSAKAHLLTGAAATHPVRWSNPFSC